MEGNTSSKPTDDIHYALRITFAIVHAVILTLCSFGLALFFPNLSQLLGCVIIPMLSLVMTIFCNGCVEYLAQSTLSVSRILKTAWIPPLGVFCVNLIILPLEFLPAVGPINTLVVTSIVVNFLLTTVLQVYAAKDIQESSSKSGGSSVPT